MQDENKSSEKEPKIEPQAHPIESEVVHYPEPSIPSTENESEVPESIDIQKLDEVAPSHNQPEGKFATVKHWYLNHKKIAIPATVILVLLILAAIPVSRYTISGLVVKKDLIIIIKDSTTSTPVSGAEVSLDSQKVLTDANGKATLLKLKPGPKIILISKKYYKDQTLKTVLPVIKNVSISNLSLAATGRQVSVRITDYVDGKTLGDVNISVAGTNSKTDKDGKATLVVPVGSVTQRATLEFAGYNKKTADIKVSDKVVELNELTLTPAGKIYFFSKRTGKLDLLKSNLDGDNVTTVLPASGFEQEYNSSISQSPDWKYVALILKRSSEDVAPQLYILSTEDDKLITIDSGKANFNFQGWSGHNLIYTAVRTDTPDSQAGKNKLKSYSAQTGKITQLDQTNGITNAEGSAYETYSFHMVSGNSILYAKNWQIVGSASQQNTLHSINADGQNHKLIASYEASSSKLPISYSQHSVNSVYIWQQEYNAPGSFYEFTIGNATPKKLEIDSNDFYVGTQGYYPSPSGKQTLWTEMRDGKNAILIGDQNGSNPKSLASFSEYLPFGWYSDKYIILSKSNNELYIMSAREQAKPLKITDYQYTNYYY
jgi:hypothetical protein